MWPIKEKKLDFRSYSGQLLSPIASCRRDVTVLLLTSTPLVTTVAGVTVCSATLSSASVTGLDSCCCDVDSLLQEKRNERIKNIYSKS